jgi:hypothetical protein
MISQFFNILIEETHPNSLAMSSLPHLVREDLWYFSQYSNIALFQFSMCNILETIISFKVDTEEEVTVYRISRKLKT